MLTKIGLDLGYANITLSDVTSGIYREPSVALVDKESRSIVAVGNSAIMGETENASGGILVRPFKNGLLFDKAITEGIINNAVKAVLPAEYVRCVLGVPSDLLPKQERELDDMKRDIHTVQAVFERSMHESLFAALSPVSFTSRGSLCMLVVRGSEEEVAAKVAAMSPKFFEILPLTLEEIFISEMEVRGYDYSKVLF